MGDKSLRLRHSQLYSDVFRMSGQTPIISSQDLPGILKAGDFFLSGNSCSVVAAFVPWVNPTSESRLLTSSTMLLQEEII